MRRLAAGWIGLAVAAWVILAGPARAQTVDAFGSALKSWAAPHGISRAFVVVRRGGKVVYEYSLGGLDPKQPVMLASLSKGITATCVATLVRDGRLSFDTPLSVALARFFSANPKPADPRALTITVGQLLHHRSGIAGAGSGGDPGTGASLVAFLGPHKASDPPGAAFYNLVFRGKLTRDPGTAFDYSNAGYLVLAAVIEEASGRPYATYCRDAVLTPLGAAGGLDPTWAIIGPFGGWRLSGESYLRFTDIFDPANPTLGKTADAFLFAPDGAAANNPGAAWYGLGTWVRRTPNGYTTFHWGEWRYAIAAKNNPLTVNFNTFVTRTADGTAWFVYLTPAVTSGGAKDQLDAALLSAYRAVKTWP
jgi:CubicO group peptidase (beta-lactamase class C family)